MPSHDSSASRFEVTPITGFGRAEGEEPSDVASPPAHSDITELRPVVRVEVELPYAEARKQAILEFERIYVKALLARAQGNVSQAARDAKIDRVYLHRLIRRHGTQRRA